MSRLVLFQYQVFLLCEEGDVLELGVQTANVLFVYDNVIKAPGAYILKLAAAKYSDKLKDFIHLELPNTASLDAINHRLMYRTVKNPIEWLAKKKFDYDKTYEELKAKSLRLYEDSIPLRSYDTLKLFSKSYCIGKIYVWNPVEDKRQLYDLSSIMDANPGKVQFVISPTLQQAIDSIGNVHVVYDWDIDRVAKLVDSGVNDDILFTVANYPFNFEEDRKLKHGMHTKRNVAPFQVYIPPEKIPCYG